MSALPVTLLSGCFCLLSSIALAEGPPTVALTQAELQTFITEETAKAIAGYIAATSAKDVLTKIDNAFKPKPVESKHE